MFQLLKVSGVCFEKNRKMKYCKGQVTKREGVAGTTGE